MTKIVCVVLDSENSEIKEIDLLEEMIEGRVTYFPDIKTMMDEGDDYSENKVFVIEVVDFGKVQNNPKFISVKEEPKKKSSKK